MKPDLLITWPASYDYPPFRERLELFRPLFARVIVGLEAANNKLDLSGFLGKALGGLGCEVIPSPDIGGSWRQTAVRLSLERSDSEWVMFTEQDFFHDTSFIHSAFNLTAQHDIIGVEEGRLHPCFLLTKRSMIDKTTKRFDPDGSQGSDHFSVFTNELRAQSPSIFDIKANKIGAWFHMSGITCNLYCASMQTGHIHMRNDFIAYLQWSLHASTIHNEIWSNLTRQTIARLGPMSQEPSGLLEFLKNAQ